MEAAKPNRAVRQPAGRNAVSRWLNKPNRFLSQIWRRVSRSPLSAAKISLKVEAFFIGLCVLGFAAGICFYLADYRGSLAFGEENPLGHVMRQRNAVRRLAPNRALWDRLRHDSAIYPGDTLVAGNFSEAEILFARNERLFLSENSSVRIPGRGESMSRIELRQGSVAFETAGLPVTVFSGINAFELNPRSKAKFRIADDGGFAVTVFRGSGSLDSGKGRSRHAEEGDALFSASDGVVSDAPAIAVTSPQPGACFPNPLPGRTPVEFKWRKINFAEGEPLTLELAMDSEFSSNAAKYILQNENGATVELVPGAYYWRAYADSPGPNTASGKFDVAYARAPQAISPVQGYTRYSAEDEPGIHFHWSASKETSAVLLEVADNPGMDGPILKRRFEAGLAGAADSFFSKSFGGGTWYWRLTAFYSGGGDGEEIAVSSPARPFSIARDLAMESPRLLFPEPAETVSIGPGQQIFFSWEAVPGAVSYTFLAAKGEALMNVVLDASTDRNYFVYESSRGALEEGDYYWAVFQTDKNGNESPITEVRRFSAQRNNPRRRFLFPPDNYTTYSSVSPDLSYVWKSSFQYPEIFQISSRSDFAGDMLVEEKLPGASVNGRFLPPGVYYWRVVTEIPGSGGGDHGSGGADETPFRIDSPPMRIEVLPEFSAPAAVTPAEGENIQIAEGVPVEFRWERANRADAYEFKLYSEQNGDLLCNVSSLGNTEVQAYFSPWTVGRYRWTVQAFTETGDGAARRRSLIASSRFSIGPPNAEPVAGFVNVYIKAGEARTPIALNAPKSGTRLINDLSSPPSVSWSVDEPLENFRVIFSRNQQPTADPMAIIQYVDKDVTSIGLPSSLGEGIWHWIVQGDTPSGQGLSAPEPFWFTVLARPLHPVPERLLPEANAVITLDQLMANRSIVFKWKEVPEANAYIFSLYSNAGRQELLISSSPSPDTSYVLTDLAILNMDDYVWQVEAVTATRSGALERRGMIERNSFKVAIPHSGNLRTRSQGILYGH